MMGKVQELVYYALVVLSLNSYVDASQTCYKLNGDAAYKDFIPCNQFSGSTSFCCGANRENTTATYTNDVCMTNGLCLAVAEDENGVEEWNYFRESCSSTDWPTNACLRHVCTTPDDNDVNGNAHMTPCDNTTYSETWCCGKNNTACCGTDGAITLAATLGATASLTATSTSTASASATSSAPASASTTAASGSGLSTGASAGIGVGVAVGALALIAAGTFWYVRRRRASRSSVSENDSNLMGGRESGSPEPEPVKTPYQDYQPAYPEQKSGAMQRWNGPVELDSRGYGEMEGFSRGEMDGQGRGELEGTHGSFVMPK